MYTFLQQMCDCVGGDNTTLWGVVTPYCIVRDAATNLNLTHIEGLIVTSMSNQQAIPYWVQA